MITLVPTLVPEPPELEAVGTALRALPRAAAPPRVARVLRRELARIRRRVPRDELREIWPTAVSVQMVLLAALWALYLVATPPAAVVSEGPAPTAEAPEAAESRRARASNPRDASRQSHPKTGPTTR